MYLERHQVAHDDGTCGIGTPIQGLEPNGTCTPRAGTLGRGQVAPLGQAERPGPEVGLGWRTFAQSQNSMSWVKQNRTHFAVSKTGQVCCIQG